MSSMNEVSNLLISGSENNYICVCMYVHVYTEKKQMKQNIIN